VDKEPSVNTLQIDLHHDGVFNMFLFAMDFFSWVPKKKGGKKKLVKISAKNQARESRTMR
jgi:hypothetical protein